MASGGLPLPRQGSATACRMKDVPTALDMPTLVAPAWHTHQRRRITCQRASDARQVAPAHNFVAARAHSGEGGLCSDAAQRPMEGEHGCSAQAAFLHAIKPVGMVSQMGSSCQALLHLSLGHGCRQPLTPRSAGWQPRCPAAPRPRCPAPSAPAAAPAGDQDMQANC